MPASTSPRPTALAALAALLAIPLATTLACSPSADVPTTTAPSTDADASPSAPADAEADAKPEGPGEAVIKDAPFDVAAIEAAGGVAYFAGGCFWGVEHFLEQIDGVLRVESGYMGGHVDSPSYQDVLTHESGHYEAVRVYFDPAKVNYEVVAKRFFEIHDPTQANGQGPDIGPQYRSAVFVTGDEQRTVTEGLIERLKARDYAVVTEVLPAATFWPAEEYHQNYYARKGDTPYCHAPVDRFGD